MSECRKDYGRALFPLHGGRSSKYNDDSIETLWEDGDRPCLEAPTYATTSGWYEDLYWGWAKSNIATKTQSKQKATGMTKSTRPVDK